MKGADVCVHVTVSNAGTKYNGREVVQVYYSAPAGHMEKPYQELAAYAKTKELRPGESQSLTLTFPITSMASYAENRASYVLEQGEYFLRVGTHSRATHVIAALVLEQEVVTEKLTNLLAAGL